MALLILNDEQVQAIRELVNKADTLRHIANVTNRHAVRDALDEVARLIPKVCRR